MTQSSSFDLCTVIREMKAVARAALRRMYLPQRRLFAFTLRRKQGVAELEGASARYTAISLIGLADDEPETAAQVLGDTSMAEVCDVLVQAVQNSSELGEVALALWAARRLRHPAAGRAMDKLRAMAPLEIACPTVELAWVLSALTIGGDEPADATLARRISQRLLNSRNESSCLFSHYAHGVTPPRLRAHVCCYADLVYPIQALSSYHLAANDAAALEAANRCARRMCELQGSQGQWWWHYDVRTGRVVERFPVYAVHQDAMGPMCLFALAEAGGAWFGEAIARSVRWLVEPAELKSSLIDANEGVIWRKVFRREPHKLARKLQAVLSAVHPALRVPCVDTIFPPGEVDWESRPYHMGWLLHAFSESRISRLTGGGVHAERC